MSLTSSVALKEMPTFETETTVTQDGMGTEAAAARADTGGAECTGKSQLTRALDCTAVHSTKNTASFVSAATPVMILKHWTSARMSPVSFTHVIG